ncbi:hypothetical protein [Arsenicicoccus dermatophilus]|uniref:hypothetical protein n=1 Tax=Arsenicicoccus dermatophilus TaxID=1076331 RepID=UPI00391760D3
MSITVDDWRALARSAPWLWQTLRCVVTPAPGDEFEGHTEPIRVWTGREAGLRVESLQGRVHQVNRRSGHPLPTRFSTEPVLDGPPPRGCLPGVYVEQPRTAARQALYEREQVELAAERESRLAAVVRRPDGLVADRVDTHRDLDVCLISSYLWVAVMDPHELTDGCDPEDMVDRHGTRVEDVRVLEHRGRETWAATVIPLDGYDPHCSCCPLLPGRAAAELMVRTGELDEPDPQGATRFEVWLDRATGVVVRLRALDGRQEGDGFDLEIEAVDEPLP